MQSMLKYLILGAQKIHGSAELLRVHNSDLVNAKHRVKGGPNT